MLLVPADFEQDRVANGSNPLVDPRHVIDVLRGQKPDAGGVLRTLIEAEIATGGASGARTRMKAQRSR